jgi:hypothetical protein
MQRKHSRPAPILTREWLKRAVAQQDAKRFAGLKNPPTREPLFRWITEPIVTSNIEGVRNARKQRIQSTLASQPIHIQECEELLALVHLGNRRRAKQVLDAYRSRWTEFWHRELGLGHRSSKSPGTTENLRLGKLVAESIEEMQRWHDIAHRKRAKVRRKALMKERLLIAKCPPEYVAPLVENNTVRAAACAYVLARHAKETGTHLSSESVLKYFRDYRRAASDGWNLNPDEIEQISESLHSPHNPDR